MSEAHDSRSLVTLISDLAQQSTTLLQTEGRLLRAEMSEKLTKAAAGGAEVLAGALCLLAALMVLLQALVIALANAGLGAGWSSLLVGVCVALVGAFLVRSGSSNMKPSEMTPDRTQDQLKRDMRMAKDQVK